MLTSKAVSERKLMLRAIPAIKSPTNTLLYVFSNKVAERPFVTCEVCEAPLSLVAHPEVSGFLLPRTYRPLLPGAKGLSVETRAYRTQGGIREAEVSSARAKGREVHIIGP